MKLSEHALEKIGFERIRLQTARATFTPTGREWVESMRPLSGDLGLTERLMQGAELMKGLQTGWSLPLSRLEEIRVAVRRARAEGASLPAPVLSEIRLHLSVARLLKAFLARHADILPSFAPLAAGFADLSDLEKRIASCLTEHGEVRDDASRELKTIRTNLQRSRQSLRNAVEKILRRWRTQGMAPDEGATLRGGRLVIPVLAEHKRKVGGMLHDLSATGKTAYVEPAEIVELNNDVREYEVQETREVERILRELSREVGRHAEEIISNEATMGWLDGLNAVVATGMEWEGAYPMRSLDDHLMIRKGRNPNLSQRGPLQVVPLDMELGDGERALIITGPNAGGKSVAMKTAALLSVMHQCGYPVPCHPDSSLPVVKGLFVDIGDEQSIESDLSTFSSRLLWMRKTLEELEPGSLVLIDEAGTGTDPEEGGALFQSFIEQTVARRARVIATTHHGSLKVFAHTTEGVVNGAMEFDQEHLAPTYLFRKGVPGSSYAFEIAARMRLPENLIQRAKQIIGTHSDRMGTLLQDLERRLSEAEDARSAYETLKIEAEKSRADYEERSSELRKARSEKLEEAYRQAESILQTANRRIEQAVETIVQQGRIDRTRLDRKVIDKVKEEVAVEKRDVKRRREHLEATRPKAPAVTREQLPPLGSPVLLAGSSALGELVEVGERHAIVMMNGLRVKTPLDRIRLPEDGQARRSKRKGGGKTAGAKSAGAKTADVAPMPPSRPASPGKRPLKALTERAGTAILADLSVGPSLDLRGKRGDAAVKELTHYLDRAVAAGLSGVDIIHGTGTGILMKLVHEALQSRKEVASFEHAPYEEGGPGKTKVSLK